MKVSGTRSGHLQLLFNYTMQYNTTKRNTKLSRDNTVAQRYSCKLPI